VEVTTDKVDAEIPSPTAGIVARICAAEGEVVEVGAVLAEIDGEAAQVSAPEKDSSPAPAPPASPVAEPEPGGEARVTPVARRLAEDSEISLKEVEGSGHAGRITKEDVLRHARSQGATSSAPAAEVSVQREAPADEPRSAPAKRPAPQPGYASYSMQEGDRLIPMSPMRRIIADHMVYSKRTSPHVGTVAEVDMGAVVSLRSAHKKSFEATQGFKLTFLPFIVHSVVRALREFPALNASVLDEAIVEKRDVNVGVAVETEKGLVVPVVKNADRFSLAGLAAELDDLAARARSRRISADDLQGGTFTVSNPGRQGNLYGFAIINQPQVGILRMGEMVKRPVVRSVAGEEAIVIR
ncbi:2-oxo acid dehydrogenase subunit E2, partial [Myxococcota bacterium]|nr:2-oxo acid dehydrogenase subunit E2 [Myxococcota bacterium]